MNELTPRDYNKPVRPTRSTRKQLADMEQEAIVRRKAFESAASDARRSVEVDEHLAHYRSELRNDNVFKLEAQTAINARTLRQLVTHLSAGDPELGADLREDVERGARIAAGVITFQYVNRPL